MTAADRRLAWTAAAALAAHALLLFGVALPAPGPQARTPLTVTLATAPGPARADSATIAATDQAGSDTVSRHGPAAAHATGEADAAPRDTAEAGTGTEAATPLLARNRPDARRSVPDGARRAGGGPAAAETDQRLRRRAATADSRAAYLEQWRRTVEAAGNRAFPHGLVERGGGRRLTVEVTLTADGDLASARIRRGSGNPDLDASALRILRDAAPFAPFPAALRERWPRLTFAYDWRFLAGDGAVSVDTAPSTSR